MAKRLVMAVALGLGVSFEAGLTREVDITIFSTPGNHSVIPAAPPSSPLPEEPVSAADSRPIDATLVQAFVRLAPCPSLHPGHAAWLAPAVSLRRAQYLDMVNRIACDYDLPATLLDAVIIQESGYRPFAVSRAGAMGLMQIMPGTARDLGLANAFDPVANMRAGARYLRLQLDRFRQVDLALAAYNAGPERKSLKQGRIPNLPETRLYVDAIVTHWLRMERELQLVARDKVSGAHGDLETLQSKARREAEILRTPSRNVAGTLRHPHPVTRPLHLQHTFHAWADLTPEVYARFP